MPKPKIGCTIHKVISYPFSMVISDIILHTFCHKSEYNPGNSQYDNPSLHISFIICGPDHQPGCISKNPTEFQHLSAVSRSACQVKGGRELIAIRYQSFYCGSRQYPVVLSGLVKKCMQASHI